MGETKEEDPKQTYKQRLYDQYMAERQSLLQTKKETVTQLDKALLTLNAGALAISITFIREIAPKPETWTLFLLMASWLSFVISLVLVLCSFRKSAESFDRQLAIIEEDYLRESADDSQDDGNAGEIDETNAPAKQLKRFNLLSLWTFILGVFIMCAFAAFNLHSKGDDMAKKGPTLTTVNEPKPQTGVDPPKAPIKPPPPSKPANAPEKQ